MVAWIHRCGHHGDIYIYGYGHTYGYLCIYTYTNILCVYIDIHVCVYLYLYIFFSFISLLVIWLKVELSLFHLWLLMRTPIRLNTVTLAWHFVSRKLKKSLFQMTKVYFPSQSQRWNLKSETFTEAQVIFHMKASEVDNAVGNAVLLFLFSPSSAYTQLSCRGHLWCSLSRDFKWLHSRLVSDWIMCNKSWEF